jgi:hypothetical protein
MKWLQHLEGKSQNLKSKLAYQCQPKGEMPGTSGKKKEGKALNLVTGTDEQINQQ